MMNLNKIYVFNKRELLYNSILSLILSISTVCMTRVSFNGNIWGAINENYINNFGISAIILGIILYFIFLYIINLVDIPIKIYVKKISSLEIIADHRPKQIIYFWAVVIFAAWLPYYLSYYPGGVYSDTFGSISYVLSGIWTNRHPLFYTTLIGFFIKLGEVLDKNLTWSIGLFTATQMLTLGFEFLYFISWMLHHQINKSVRIVCCLFFVFFPLIPLNAISVWKDTPFCMAVLFWMMFIVDLYLEISKGIFHFKTIVGYEFGAILVAFTRNNGIYVITLSIVLLLILLSKDRRANKTMSRIKITSISVLIAIFLIQGPIYNILGVEQTEIVENLGIPLQQIGAVVTYNGYITESQKNSLNNFMPYDNIKEHYSPALVDNLKWYAGLNGQYLSEHIHEFFTLWLQLLRQNPTIYVKSYLMATLGFWDIDISTFDAYVQTFMWNNEYGITQTDYFAKWSGFSFQHFVNPRNYISCAWFFWIFFITAWFSAKHYGIKSVFLFIPQLGIWLTLMIATPIAVSLRYISASMFTLPFAIIVPLLLSRES